MFTLASRSRSGMLRAASSSRGGFTRSKNGKQYYNIAAAPLAASLSGNDKPGHRSYRAAALAALAAIGATGVMTDYNQTTRCDAERKVGAPLPLKPTFAKEVTGPKGIPSRTEQIKKLEKSSPTTPFDILVVGGGATGCGIAFDAASRDGDLRVACIERGDFASETSSRSTKLIWAGIKYLAVASAGLISWDLLFSPLQTVSGFMSEFKMIYSCHRERKYMAETQEHLTNWIPIVVPFTEWHVWPPPFGHWLFSLFPVLSPAVFKFYDSMSGFSCPPSYIMGKKKAGQMFPQLNEKKLKYAQVFYEAQHNDARTNIAIAMSAAEKGANISNYVEMTGIIRNENDEIIGINAVDRIRNEKFTVYAKNIIFAGGPFTDKLREFEHKDEDGEMPEAVRGASGSHVVLPGYYTPNGMGLLDYNTTDGRFLFLLPWQNHTLVGTTDAKSAADTLPTPTEKEIKWILKECETYLSKDLHVRRSDVMSAWKGWRPLAADPNAPPGAPASRDHVISTNAKTGITFIAGGKWTTWREMAEEAVDSVLGEGAPKCETLGIKLHGGEGYTPSLPIQLIQKHGITDETAFHLAKTYGTRAWEVCEFCQPTGQSWPRFGIPLASHYPYIEAEVRFACKEYACTIEDVLSRRTRLAFLNKEAAQGAIPRVADIMTEELGWSKKVKKYQIAAAEEYMTSYGGRIPGDDADELRAATYTDIMDIFNAIDTDGSGFLDKQEVQEMATRLGFPMSTKDVDNAFKQMDVNQDGRVSGKEFVAYWENCTTSEFRKKLAAELGLGGTKPSDIKDMGDGNLLG